MCCCGCGCFRLRRLSWVKLWCRLQFEKRLRWKFKAEGQIWKSNLPSVKRSWPNLQTLLLYCTVCICMYAWGLDRTWLYDRLINPPSPAPPHASPWPTPEPHSVTVLRSSYSPHSIPERSDDWSWSSIPKASSLGHYCWDLALLTEGWQVSYDRHDGQISKYTRG